MAAAGRRRGRRDNGLDAYDWRALEDLDPRMSEEVLDLLAAHGVAAYVQPAMDVDPVTRSATVPSRPADRLYVDRRHLDTARTTVRAHLNQQSGTGGTTARTQPSSRLGDDHDTGHGNTGHGDTGHGDTGHGDTGHGDTSRGDAGHRGTSPDEAGGTDPVSGTTRSEDSAPDVDTAFADIVAGFDRPVDPGEASWPEAEQTTRTDGEPAAGEPAGSSRGPVDARNVTESSLLDGIDTFGRDLPDRFDDDDPPERFVPPPPPPLPRLSGQTVLGFVAIVAGVILLVGRPDVLPAPRSAEMLLGFAVILGGAVALILRLRPGTDPDDDIRPDDGAEV